MLFVIVVFIPFFCQLFLLDKTNANCNCHFPLNVGDRGVAVELFHGPFAWGTTAAEGYKFIDLGITQGSKMVCYKII